MRTLLKTTVPLAALVAMYAVSHAMPVDKSTIETRSTAAPATDDSQRLDAGSPENTEGRSLGPDAGVDGGTIATPAADPIEEALDAGSPKVEPEEDEHKDWRTNPNTLRHPGSYIGFGGGYTNAHTWFTPQMEEFDDEQAFGPLHGWQAFFRVGDAFFEWFALGFQIDMTYGGFGSDQTYSAFALRLDTTFYPWEGLGIRPSLGIGFSYASGKEEFENGFGGPGSLSLALTYEIRLTRLLVIAPIAQAYWIAGEDFHGLYFFFGLEILKWFDTPTG